MVVSASGSLFGNFTGTLYFLYFQVMGIVFAHFLLSKKSLVSRLLYGSVFGSVLLMWLPALFAFFFDFTVLSHILAALSCFVLLLLLLLCKIPHADFVLRTVFSTPSSEKIVRIKSFLKKHRIFLILCGLTFALFCCLLSSHTLAVKEDGLHTGQCTYGDMNMHLSFITSIAVQGAFPPEYSISPGDKLCYPFLCDSISSSLYLMGASLRYAYLLPMYAAILQVMTGFYCFAYAWLKKAVKACLAWFFFFYNGGLGFLYFIDWSKDRTYFFKNIFTEYYQTPTNLIDKNIRFVNVIVDMLLPQRATLFGYAVLFSCLFFLWRGIYEKEKELFLPTALLGGALPMIHTHSFLALCLISASWLLMQLYYGVKQNIPASSPNKKRLQPGMLLFGGFLLLMCLLDFLNGNDNAMPPSCFLLLCLAGLFLLFCLGLKFLFLWIKEKGCRELLSTWGLYLAVILLLALPQLFYWTFSQTATGSGFLVGHFNWGNQGDSYLWFYMKNWGVILLLFFPAVLYAERKNFAVVSAGFLIWFVVELISFSPNTYDNNKLLYVAYGLFCCISADYGCDLYHSLRGIPGARIFTVPFLILSSLSALLSMGRELKSDYTVYSNAQVNAAQFIERNTAPDAVFLTNDRHVNEAASLAGRNIVSGAWIYLGPHGIYDEARAQDVRSMFEHPASSTELFEKYHVEYVTISSWERGSYQVDEVWFDEMLTCVFTCEDIKIYRVD